MEIDAFTISGILTRVFRRQIARKQTDRIVKFVVNRKVQRVGGYAVKSREDCTINSTSANVLWQSPDDGRHDSYCDISADKFHNREVKKMF